MTKRASGTPPEDTGARAPGVVGDPANVVRIVGRLAAPALARELPSGDVITTFRVIVGPRPRRGRTDRRGATTVDTLECVVWTAGLRRRLTGYAPGDLLEVEGALRRRFWRSPGGAAASRCEIEVGRVRRVPTSGGGAP